MMIKTKGLFRLYINGKLVDTGYNVFLNSGYRYLSSLLRDELAADGYGSGATIGYFHLGNGSTQPVITDWKMENFIKSFPITANNRISNNIIQVDATITGPIGFSEYGIALSEFNPVARTDYQNAVLSRRTISDETLDIGDTGTLSYEYTITVV